MKKSVIAIFLSLITMLEISTNVYAHYDSAYWHEERETTPYIEQYVDWMITIPDSRRLSEISLPGTHDTMAYDSKKAGKVEVVYCFNSTKKAPSDSYDMGEGIKELTGDLRTTVSADGKESSEKSAVVVTPKQVEEGVTITDKVDYEGLKGGEKYILTGRLMKIVEGKEAEQVGEANTTEFTADESGNGSVTIEFGKVKGLEAGAKYVVFENAVSKNNLIDANKDGELGEGDKKHEVKHENANDLAQTVLTKKGIKELTGDLRTT